MVASEFDAFKFNRYFGSKLDGDSFSLVFYAGAAGIGIVVVERTVAEGLALSVHVLNHDMAAAGDIGFYPDFPVINAGDLHFVCH